MMCSPLSERVTSLLGWRGGYLQSRVLHVRAHYSWMINSLDGGGDGGVGWLVGWKPAARSRWEKEDLLFALSLPEAPNVRGADVCDDL